LIFLLNFSLRFLTHFFPFHFLCSFFLSLRHFDYDQFLKVRVVVVVVVVVVMVVASRVAHRRVAHRRVAHRRVAHRRVQQHKLHHKQAAATINTGLTKNVNTKNVSPTLVTRDQTKRMVVMEIMEKMNFARQWSHGKLPKH
jgi:small-conductance mechanosensitive channel